MADEEAKSLTALGFLSVVEHPQHGLFGGYLVVNLAGRPLEFHCTAPVKANRAQEILYGPTLQPYLYGEQIGQTLAARSKAAVPILLTNIEPMLALRDHMTTPMALVVPEPEYADAGSSKAELAGDADSRRFGERLVTFGLGGHRLAVAAEHEADREAIVASLQDVNLRLDLAEPFQRIHAAIGEANRAA